MKSGNLNFLEPSGPLQACNGTAFTAIWRNGNKEASAVGSRKDDSLGTKPKTRTEETEER